MKFIDKIVKMFLNSHALTIFFGVMAYWLFFKPSKKKSTFFNDVDVSQSSLTDAQAKVIADECYTSFNHFLGFDDYQALKRLLLPLDNPSFNHVYKAFGKRASAASNDKQSLSEWLTEQLSEEEIKPFLKFDLVF